MLDDMVQKWLVKIVKHKLTSNVRNFISSLKIKEHCLNFKIILIYN